MLSNRQQTRNLNAQHALAIERDKIAAVVSKAEELYSDIQRWKKHFELSGFQHVAYYQMAASKDDFLAKATQNSPAIDFDLVRLELNLRAYFPELEEEFRKAEQLVHEAGKIQADMIMTFDARSDAKKRVAGEYVAAQRAAVGALDQFSVALASRIRVLMRVKGES